MTEILCATCLEEIEGGVSIDKKVNGTIKKLYFCSGKCLEEYENGR